MKMTETFCDELIAMRNAFFGYDEKTKYIFVGDYEDRGIQNKEDHGA